MATGIEFGFEVFSGPFLDFREKARVFPAGDWCFHQAHISQSASN
jgi:hypothetical protein